MLGNVGYRNFPTAFSPAALFAASEPGVWFDPSDVANTLWRYNLLTWTDQLDVSSVWLVSNTSVSANADGVADRMTELAVSSSHYITQNVIIPEPSRCTASVEVKIETGSRWFIIRSNTDGPNNWAVCNLQTGVITETGSSVVSSSITALSNSYYRVTLTWDSPTDNLTGILFGMSNTATPGTGTPSYLGDGTSSFLIRSAQFELGSTATTYQPITTVDAGTIARFPLATLYQDIAGTTPVTAPNQPVGMMLSKDKGLVLGPEIVANGNNEAALYSGAGAVNGTLVRGAAPGGGLAAIFTCNAGTLSYQALYQTIAANTPVQISVRVYVPTGSINAIQLFDAFDGSWNTATNSIKDNWVTITAIRSAKATAWALGIGQIAGQSLSGQIFYVDDLSIKALPGNHATQSTSASRPTYGIVPATGRRNLLTFSEQLDNAVWAKGDVTVVANAASSPIGTTTADRIVPTALLTSQHQTNQSVSGIVSGQQYTFSVFVKASGYNWARLGFGTSFPSNFLFVNTSTGAVGLNSAFSNILVTNQGNGWFRVSASITANASGSTQFIIYSYENNMFGSFSGDGTSGTLSWGAQLELGSAVTAYQQVVTAFEVTEANVASLSYISFDGIDDFMITPTITPGTDKVQVFAGVRKLSDAGFQAIAETSSTGSSVGSFSLGASTLTGDASRRTWATVISGTSTGILGGAAIYAAPDTRVVSILNDISQSTSSQETVMRLNGAAQSLTFTPGDAGTGDFNAYPMFIGRRNGTSSPFNGQMYGLITRFGANLTTTAISRTESWMNSKTGAF